MNTIREGGNAVIVRHCAVFGVNREPVRTSWPGHQGPHRTWAVTFFLEGGAMNFI